MQAPAEIAFPQKKQYKTEALFPLIISILSILLTGMFTRSASLRSIFESLCPLSRISVFDDEVSAKPLRSIVWYEPNPVVPYKSLNENSGTFDIISGKDAKCFWISFFDNKMVLLPVMLLLISFDAVTVISFFKFL